MLLFSTILDINETMTKDAFIRLVEDPVNVSYLASRLKGVAHVMLKESNWLNQTIKNQCDGNNEYYGAIGIYYPSQG